MGHAMSSGVTLGAMCRKVQMVKGDISAYKRISMHKHSPVEAYIEQCTEEWNKLQEDWKARGWDSEYLPYPYSLADVKGWFQSHASVFGMVEDGGFMADDSQVHSFTGSGFDANQFFNHYQEPPDDPGEAEANFQWW